MKRLVFLCILLFVFLPNSYAAGRPEIRFKAAGASIGCASGGTFVYLDGPFATIDNALSYPYAATVSAGNNIYESAGGGSAPGSLFNNPIMGWRFETGNSGGQMNASFPIPNDTRYTLHFVLYDPNGVPSWVAVVTISKCNGGAIVRLDDYPYPDGGLPSIGQVNDGPPDDRINWHYGDAHIGILYPSDNGGINLYTYADDSYAFDFVSPAMLETYADNLPASPILLAQHGLVAAYLLPDGRIQFNLGPDAEGKWYEVILDDLADRDIDGIAHDPNQ